MLLRRDQELPCGCMPMGGQLVNLATGVETQDWRECDTTSSVTMLDGTVVAGQFEQRCGACPSVWR